ncbi:Monoacylglycerol lipase abhd6-A [Morella rubra]|uniref:Monoacylglycerol lipase abhd6-A n=1 Tax=Morella rubra TaxID=262757 RepID=A0A6A1UMN4_9ROSI|nr:Monoacylglycerol lipase abhd6-A [Morella rubra]
MPKWFSFAAVRNWLYRQSFSKAGLKSTTTDLGEGTLMHCWVPKVHSDSKPNLLLIHGVGANAMWQWSSFISPLLTHFNLYVPDLVFFGDSYTKRPDRSEAFQARCVMAMMEAQGVVKTMNIAGISYGGFVAYSMATQFRERVDRLVLCCAGVCMEDKDMDDGLFKVKSVDEAISILLPSTPEKMKELMRLTFVKPSFQRVPSCILNDFIHVSPRLWPLHSHAFFWVLVEHAIAAFTKGFASHFDHHVKMMSAESYQEKKELILALHKDRKFCDLPRITQPTLIIWGEQDQVFPLELAHRLKRHVGENAQLEIIKNAGHAINIEKPKEVCKFMKSFLVDPFPSPKEVNQRNGHKVD